MARTSSTSLSSNNWIQIGFLVEEYDSNGAWNGAVYTVPEDGIYEVNGVGTVSGINDGINNIFMVWKNGSRAEGGILGRSMTGGSGLAGHGASIRLVCQAGDTLEMRGFTTQAGVIMANGTDQEGYSTFSAFKLLNSGDQDLSNYVQSNTTGEPTGSDSISNVVSLTQAEYDTGVAFSLINPTTTYLITDA